MEANGRSWHSFIHTFDHASPAPVHRSLLLYVLRFLSCGEFGLTWVGDDLCTHRPSSLAAVQSRQRTWSSCYLVWDPRSASGLLCRVDYEDAQTTMDKPSVESTKRSRSGDALHKASAAPPATDLVYPVYCAVCSLHIAYFDADEIYHFVQVLASEA